MKLLSESQSIVPAPFLLFASRQSVSLKAMREAFGVVGIDELQALVEDVHAFIDVDTAGRPFSFV